MGCALNCLTHFVFAINLTALVWVITSHITIREDIVGNWQFYFHYDVIFKVGVGCLATGLIHTKLWYIAECLENITLMKSSVVLGYIKETVSFNSILF